MKGKMMKENKWLYLSVILVLLNAILSWVVASKHALPTAEMVGYLLGVVLVPLIVVGIFQLFKKFRNFSSRIKIFFWVSLIIFVEKFVTILKYTYGN